MRFKRGLELFDEGEYKLALVEFERAYELAPNFRALYNIALVNIQLGRYAEASQKFQAYLKDGGDAIPPTRRAEIVHTLSELELRTATLELSTNAPGTKVTLDGKPVTVQLPGSLLIDAGEHTISASAPGYDRMDRSLTLAGADHTSVRFNLVPAARPISPGGEGGPEPARQHVFWPGVVATGALAVGAAVSFGVMLDAHSSWSQLENTLGPSQSALDTYANRNNTAGLTADILGGLAVISGGVTLYLSLRTDRSTRSPSVAITPRSIALSENF